MKKEERELYLYNLKHKIDEKGVLLKQCSICKEWFPCAEEYFYKNRSKEGFSPYCKKCEMIKNRKWTVDPKNKESVKKAYAKSDSNRGYAGMIMMRENSRTRRLNGKHQQWQRDNPEKMRGYRLDREQNKTHTISKQEWENCQDYFNNSCAYCGLPIEEHFITRKGVTKLGSFHKEHVNHNGANDLSNCVPACKLCNSEKYTHTLEKWFNKNNIKFSEERLNKIHKWLNGDYKMYEEKKEKKKDLPYIIKRIKNIDDNKCHFELWSKDENNQPLLCLDITNKKADLNIHMFDNVLL